MNVVSVTPATSSVFVSSSESAIKMGDEERKKREEKERKKAEVRKRLEESAKAKKPKKGGFMTPERKKKLRVLLRKMAAEQLKAEQEKRAQERRKIIKERCGNPKAIDGANEGKYQRVRINAVQRWSNLRKSTPIVFLKYIIFI
uniref:Troponin I n=1 Tax=Strigamia maritima TaxID=126957 RepID=T1JM14_STRMM